MAVAVIPYKDLLDVVTKHGFPKHTKVKLIPGGFGHKLFDDLIRTKVKFISETEYNPTEHVKITESAYHVGEIPEPWEIRCQKFLEGEDDHNPFKPISGSDSDGEAFKLYTHVNRAAIQIAVSTAAFRYRIDYVHDADGSVATENFLNVAIYDTAEDSSISYSSNLAVEQLWTTRVVPYESNGVTGNMLQKRAYFHDPIREDCHPWVDEGPLTADELELWTQHNVKPETTIQHLAETDFRQIEHGKYNLITMRPITEV